MKTISRFAGTLSLLLALAIGVVVFGGSAAHAAAPTDHNKNYLYALQSGSTCLNGDLVQFNQKDGDRQGCIRLSSTANDGYSLITLSGNSTPDGKMCLSSVGLVVSSPYGWMCVIVSDSTRWDNSDYSANAGGTDIVGTGPPDATCGAIPNIKCDGSGNGIYDLINFIVNWIIRLLGAAAIISIIVAGIQYITSQGSPDAVKAAKSRITNAVVGLILLSLMFFILRFLGVMK